jgi:hypothetical protein
MAGREEPQGERLSVDRKQRIEDEKIEGAWEWNWGLCIILAF